MATEVQCVGLCVACVDVCGRLCTHELVIDGTAMVPVDGEMADGGTVEVAHTSKMDLPP